jgi:hypothetical protein
MKFTPKKMLAGGLLGRAISSATKKFLKEGINRFPSSTFFKEGLSKNQKSQANTFRKAKIAEFAHNRLQKLGANIFKKVGIDQIGKIKTSSHLKRAEKMGSSIIKDQKKLETMVDTMKLKNLTSQGKKTN